MASLDEARLAVSYGASAVGLVSAMPSGPGPIPDDLIRTIAAAVPPGVATFLLTCKQNAPAIIEQHRTTRTSAIQIVDEFPMDEYAILKANLPGIKLVQVVHVSDEVSIQYATDVAKHVDAILLDSGNPRLPVKELGGTGRVHDWTISRTIRETVGIPVYLAGGLNADNVGDAISIAKPFAVDVCSGVRTGGKLDEKKLSAFFAAVSEAPMRE